MFRKAITKFTVAATLVLGSGITPLAISAAPASAAPCPAGTWSSTAQGRPATLAPGSATGMYLWHDSDGWHLRVTHPGNANVVFRGTIDSVGTGPFDIARVATESADLVAVNPFAGKIHFRMENHGRIDGIDFKVGCAKNVTLTLKASGALLPTTQIHLGAAEANPTVNPVVIARTVPVVPEPVLIG